MCGLALLWDVTGHHNLFHSILAAWPVEQAYAAPLLHDVARVALLEVLGSQPAMAPTSHLFGSWPPRWYLDAANQGAAIIRDGSKAEQLILALLGEVRGRGVPSYTAYAANVIADLTANLGPGFGSCPLELWGTVSVARVLDWVHHTEQCMLREYLTVEYPNYVMVWDSQVLAGSRPPRLLLPAPARTSPA